jgi:hypothetical protein
LILNSRSSGRRGGLPGRRGRIAIAGLVLLLAVGVPSALAIHDFTDVPDSNPFHGDIAAIKRAGITSGKTCETPGTPPTYCPSENITREAMAAFAHRGFGRVGFNQGNDGDIPAAGGRDLAVVTIQVGGVAGQTQFVKLDGNVTSHTGAESACPCTAAYNIVQDGVGGVSFFRYNAHDDDELGAFGLSIQTGSVSVVVAVPSGTTQTFRLVGERFFGGQVNAYGELSAVVAPFGSTGTNTLGADPEGAGGKVATGDRSQR